MYHLDRKLNPDEFIQTFFDVNKDVTGGRLTHGKSYFAKASAQKSNYRAGARNVITS
jgi:hypothetical protein